MEDKINVMDNYPSDNHTKKVLRIIGMVFVGVIFAILFALVFGFLVKWLWNFLMPDLFGLSQITYLQAFAMVVMTKLLFGAFGPHYPKRPAPHHPPFRKWHDRFDCHDHASWDNRKTFRRFWEEEGKEVFDAYLKKTRAEKDETKDE
jgi:hypothetical protein